MVVKVYDCEWTSVAEPKAHTAKTQQRAVVSLFRVSIRKHSVSVGPAQAHDRSVQQFFQITSMQPVLLQQARIRAFRPHASSNEAGELGRGPHTSPYPEPRTPPET